MNSPFKLSHVSNDCWAVTWPEYEHHVVGSATAALKLLEILFDIIKVDEAMVGVQQRGRDNDWHTMHISSSVWFDQHHREHLVEKLANYVVPGVRFNTRQQAQQFQEHMEKRLVWSRVSNGQRWS